VRIGNQRLIGEVVDGVEVSGHLLGCSFQCREARMGPNVLSTCLAWRTVAVKEGRPTDVYHLRSGRALARRPGKRN
jgi:hypothetical protein